MSHHTKVEESTYEVPRFVQEWTFERLSVEPLVDRRPGATRAGDTITLRIAGDSYDSCITLRLDEVDALATFLPYMVRNARLERLHLQCQEMGLTPVQNDLLAALIKTSGAEELLADWK